MGWFTRRRKSSPGSEPAELEPISDRRSDWAPADPRADAGPPWVGRALSLPAMPTPDAAPELARRAVEAALKVSGINLDYSPASLHHVDAILDGFRKPGSDVMAETIFVFGCYLGEVMVRNAGYVWVDTPTDLARHLGALTVHHPDTDSHANPISKAFKRVDYGEPDNLTYFYRVFTDADLPLSPPRPE